MIRVGRMKQPKNVNPVRIENFDVINVDPQGMRGVAIVMNDWSCSVKSVAVARVQRTKSSRSDEKWAPTWVYEGEIRDRDARPDGGLSSLLVAQLPWIARDLAGSWL